MRNFKGSKLEETKGLSTTDIAKLVRKDIKAAKKAGLPVGKVSVRTRYFAGGSSIDVEVVSLHPVAGPLFSVGAAMDELDGCNVYWGDQQSPLYKRIMDTLNGILGQYNYDNSDTMTDYWDVRFYGHVEFAHDLNESELARSRDEARKVRAHEQENEDGAEWVNAYWTAYYKRESAGHAVAQFADAVKCCDPVESAEYIAKLEREAEELVELADAARASWERLVAESNEPADGNDVARVISYEEVLAAAEPDDRPVVGPAPGGSIFDAITVDLETGDISYPAVPGFELNMDRVYQSARLFAVYCPSMEMAVKHAVHEQISAHRGMQSLLARG